jgi:putative transposase
VCAPNRLLVADFTYVKLVTGVFVCAAFVIGACAGAIIGWEASASKQTRFVEPAIRRAVALRSRQGHPIVGAIHHSDAGPQYTSVRFVGTLPLSGLRPSVGSVGDAYDNALAQTTIRLYKNECVRADSPFRRGPLRVPGDVELITADYVARYNRRRLMHRLGRVPPAEAEAQYYSEHVTGQPASPQNPEDASNPGCLTPPTVVFQDVEYSGITESNHMVNGTAAKSIVTGGKSPGWVNGLITFSIQYGLSQLADVIEFAYDASGLGSVIAEGAYQPVGANGLFALYQGDFDDTLLAYQRFTDPARALYTGDMGFLEEFHQGAGTAYTISGVLSLRAGDCPVSKAMMAIAGIWNLFGMMQGQSDIF